MWMLDAAHMGWLNLLRQCSSSAAYIYSCFTNYTRIRAHSLTQIQTQTHKHTQAHTNTHIHTHVHKFQKTMMHLLNTICHERVFWSMCLLKQSICAHTTLAELLIASTFCLHPSNAAFQWCQRRSRLAEPSPRYGGACPSRPHTSAKR
jgi:hypothetical protein